MDELGTYLSQAVTGVTYTEPLALHAAPDSRCILCDAYITYAPEQPTGVDIHGFRLPSTQETLAEKLESVLSPACGTSLHAAALHWQMKHICMACSAVIMTLDSYETKILEIREEIKRKFMEMVKIRTPKFGHLQALPPPPPLQQHHASSSSASSPAPLHGRVLPGHQHPQHGPGVKREVGVGAAPGDDRHQSPAISVVGAAPGEDTAVGERLECEVDLPPSVGVVSAGGPGRGASVAGDGSPLDELTCPICRKTFRNKYNLKRHSTVHAGVRPFSCQFCPRTFRQKDHLKIHCRSGPQAVPLACAPCGLSFPCFTVFSEHRQRYHSEVGDNACRHCDLVFATATELRRHCRQEHPHPVKQEFCCTVCGRAFPNGFNMRRHHLTHSGERPFPCQTCGKRFTQPSILKKHFRVHEKKLPEVKELISTI